MPAGQDQEIAVIFREMRRASEMPLDNLSAELGTSPHVIEALEAGNIPALPDWPETARIITAYALKLGLDSRPVLRRLKAQFPQSGSATPKPAPATPKAAPRQPPAAAPPPQSPVQPTSRPPPPAAKGPPLPPGADTAPPPRQERPAPPPKPQATPDGSPAPDERKRAARAAAQGDKRKAARPARRMGLRAGTVMTWILLLALFAGMGFVVRYASQRPAMVWSMVDQLPQPAPRMIRTVREMLRPGEGGKPSSTSDKTSVQQKSDKLPDPDPVQRN